MNGCRRRSILWWGMFLLFPALACHTQVDAHKQSDATEDLSPSNDLTGLEGERLLEEFQCDRCHSGPHSALASDGCVGCHQAILTREFDAPADTLESWASTLSRSELAVVQVPNLDRVGWLRAEWIAGFLQDPHDVRPFLGPSMPRLLINASQADSLAAFLSPAPNELVDLTDADIGRGRALVENGSCGTCHLYDGRSIGDLSRVPIESRRLAPDLAEASRWRPAALLRWLRNPQSMDAGSSMPPTGFSENERRDVAAYLLQPLRRAPSEVPARLPVLARAVFHEEVETRVFRRVCWHCHGDPDYAHGDGGPGNTGGLGFFPRRLDLSSYEGVHSGAVDENGRRYSVLADIEIEGESMPRVVAVLWARHHEEARQPIDGLRGMPLGIAPMALEDIQLVETWVSQGALR